jgi:demethoxyubiquinone hydroxylase (CLK1/Coq7/Cat5 family)
MDNPKPESRGSYNVSIIRPVMRNDDCKMRVRLAEPAKVNEIKKALRALNTLELMAQTIYRFQITSEDSELNRQLVAAMCNEMTHYQDFQIKLYEYGLAPSAIRWLYWILGCAFGFGSRLLGKKKILKTGIWVETKAVHHYAQLLDTVDWDEDTRKIIEKNQADEDGHINRWKKLLDQAT